MRFLLIKILTLICFFANAQGFQRQYQVAGSLNHVAKAVFETTPGNYIMGGLVLDTANGIQFTKLAFIGIDSQGQKTWTKMYGNSKFQYLSNPFITRIFYKQGNYIYHAGSVKDSNDKYLGVFMKINMNGDTLWQKKFYETNYDVVPQSVTGSIDGGFLITGFFQQPGIRPVLLIKTDVNGNELWRKKIDKIGPNGHDAKSIIQDTASKKIVTVGYQYIGSAIKSNFMIFDSLGNVLSQTNYAGMLGGWIYDLIQTKDKKLVAVGRALYPQTIGGDNLTHSFIIKYDLNAPDVPLWKIDNFDKLSLFNTFTCLRELKNGDLLVGGLIDTMQINGLPRHTKLRLTKFSPSGSLLWNRYYDYGVNVVTNTNVPIAYDLGLNSIEIASNGDWLAAVPLVNLTGKNPYFFVKYDSTGCDSSTAYCESVSGIYENKSLEMTSINVFPNPNNGVLNIQLNNYNRNISVRLINQLNQTVLQKEINPINDIYSLNVDNYSPGFYILNIYSNGVFLGVKKIMIE